MNEDNLNQTEKNTDFNTDGYTWLRNTLFSASLGILKYIAVIFPKAFFHWTKYLFPKVLKLVFRTFVLSVLLAILATLLCWPFIYWFAYHRGESKQIFVIIEIIWLLSIGIPGAYLGIRSSKKWIARWRTWRQRKKQTTLSSKIVQMEQTQERLNTGGVKQ